MIFYVFYVFRVFSVMRYARHTARHPKTITSWATGGNHWSGGFSNSSLVAAAHGRYGATWKGDPVTDG